MGMADDVLQEFESELSQTTEALRTDLGKVRTGRATLSLLDGIRVDYYGSSTPIAQCASLTVAEARLIVVKPWDKSLIGQIERAIQAADIGITPQNDGEIVRLPIPALTEERRRVIVKQSKARGEEARISVRTHRRDANEMLKSLEKDKELTQDELKRTLERVQELTDKWIEQIDQALTKKEKEILEV